MNENGTDKNGVNAFAEIDKGLEKRMKNLNPLPKNVDGLTEEQKQRIHEIRSKGGKARAEQMSKERSLKEITNALLNTKVSKERAKKILGDYVNDIPDDDLTNSVLVVARMIKEVYDNGTAKAAEYIRDTAGQKPREEIALNADITTDSDRALMADIAQRLGILPKENDD